MSKTDEYGEFIHIAGDGLVKLDGITIFRKIVRNGKLYLEFRDRDRMRAQARKTPYVEIPLEILTMFLIDGKSKADELVPHHPAE